MEKIELNASLTSQKPSYDRFAEIQQKIVHTSEQEIELSINIEKRLGLSFLFCISTIPALAKSLGKNVQIKCNQKSVHLLGKTGYIPSDGSIVSFETDLAPFLWQNSRVIKDVNNIYTLVKEITKEAPVEMSEPLAELFTSKAGEMYNNSMEHSGGQYVIGGKYFKNQRNIYCFSCYDTGIGIPQKVQNSIGQSISVVEAFKWAMKRGNSTANKEKETPIPRGLGLDLLREFAKANAGAIRICSGKVLYKYNPRKGIRYYALNHEFAGTLFEMDIIADNAHRYALR
jgi:hypothetical protein